MTILDDHSRYSICINACNNETRVTVQSALAEVFRTYGLPKAILCDNGPPWGDEVGRFTRLTVWLIRMGIQVPYARSFHPQTRGKIERFHRSLKAEVVQYCGSLDLNECQKRFDRGEPYIMRIDPMNHWTWRFRQAGIDEPTSFSEKLPPSSTDLAIMLEMSRMGAGLATKAGSFEREGFPR